MTPNPGSDLSVGGSVQPPGSPRGAGPEFPSDRAPLQQFGRANSRRHFLAPVVRWSVLLAGDLTLLFTLRTIGMMLRDSFALLPDVSSFLGSLFPFGSLGGWQFAVAVVVGLTVTGTYGPGDPRRDPARLFGGCALAGALTLWHPLWARGFSPVASEYVALVLILWGALVVERMLVDQLVRAYRVDRAGTGFALLVGSEAGCAAPEVARLLAPGGEFVAVGLVDTSDDPGPNSLGGVHRFGEVLARSGADTVILCGDLPASVTAHIVDQVLCAKCRLLSPSRLVYLPGLRPGLTWHGRWPVIELTAPTLNAWQLMLKRVTDLLLAGVGLLLLAPVMLLLALAVKLGSPGPVLFRQRRVGQAGRLFDILKFRSMVSGAETTQKALRDQSIYADQRLFKMKDDPRITPVGRWLRRTSLDELPQLYNVLRGEMSLVGPRPPLPEEVAYYEEHHFFRFDMKPGITGPWQVSGRNSITDFDEVIRLESEYIRHWHPGLDLVLLIRTLPAVLRMRGAL